MRKNHSSVPTVELPSLSALRSKSSSNLKATLMNQSAVPHAARPERHHATEMTATATDPSARCSPQYVLSVAKTPKYLSSPERIDQYIVVNATRLSERPHKDILTSKKHIGQVYLAYVWFW